MSKYHAIPTELQPSENDLAQPYAGVFVPSIATSGTEQAPQPIRFTVYGRPVPQGSMRSFQHRRTGKVVTTSANLNLKPWRQEISETAMTLRAQRIEGPVAMGLHFYFARPKSVPKARLYPTVKPDLDKIIRAILDSLTGILYRDDSQVVRFDEVAKDYGEPERVEIQVREIG